MQVLEPLTAGNFYHVLSHGFLLASSRIFTERFFAGGPPTFGKDYRPGMIGCFCSEENYLHAHGQRAMQLLTETWTLEQ